jgi:hypothetical protein
MLMKLFVAGMVSVAILAATAPARGARAQYPPPTGNCVIVTSASAVASGGSVTVTVTVRDGNGNPVANIPVPVNITRQPGTDASITLVNSTTDANGQVTGTLYVGTTGGQVEVTASPAGLSCKATVTVGTITTAPGVLLPSTGAGIGSGRALSAIGVSLSLAAAGAFVAGIGLRRRSRHAGR